MWELENITTWTEELNLESSSPFYDDLANSSFTNYTNTTVEALRPPILNVPYAVLESLVAIVAVIGNALVIIVFYRERRLRRRTNYYIISLALADFLVGLLGIPFAILVRQRKQFKACYIIRLHFDFLIKI